METRKFSYAINKEYLANEQYAGMGNYQHRKSDAFLEWHALQYTGAYDLNSFGEILEVGCGDGTFWKFVINGHAFQPHVVITDLAEKMLKDCKHNLSTVNINADYQVADIDVLPFGPGTFNAVLAHKVIYHAENPEKALAGILHVLQPNGILGLSLLNHGVNQSIWKLANSINPQIPDQSLSSRFSDLEADQTLPKIFAQVEKRNYFNTLQYKTSEPIVTAVKSNPIIQPLKLSDNFFTLFKEKIEERIEEQGYFETEYNASLYLCRKNK